MTVSNNWIIIFKYSFLEQHVMNNKITIRVINLCKNTFFY